MLSHWLCPGGGRAENLGASLAEGWSTWERTALCKNFLITCAFAIGTFKNVMISCASAVQTCNWHVFTNTEIGFQIATEEDTIE